MFFVCGHLKLKADLGYYESIKSKIGTGHCFGQRCDSNGVYVCVRTAGLVSLGLALLCCFQNVWEWLCRSDSSTHRASCGLEADKFGGFCALVANPASVPQGGFPSQNTLEAGGTGSCVGRAQRWFPEDFSVRRRPALLWQRADASQKHHVNIAAGEQLQKYVWVLQSFHFIDSHEALEDLTIG